MIFSNKKFKSNNSEIKLSNGNSNRNKLAGQPPRNIIGDLLANNRLHGTLVGVFNTRGSTAALMADLNVFCQCDRFGPETCKECAQRISTMDSGPGDGVYALFELIHDDYEMPIGCLTLFDFTVTELATQSLIVSATGDQPEAYRLALNFNLLQTLNDLDAYHWDTLNIDSALNVADSQATWETKTAILRIDTYPGVYDVFTFCKNDPAPVPFAAIALHKDFSHIFSEVKAELPSTKSEIASQNSERIVMTSVRPRALPITEQTYAMNRVIAFHREDQISSVSWMFCGVLDGHKDALELANDSGLHFDDESDPIVLRRYIARGLLDRGRLSVATEIFDSIVNSPPQDDPDEEIDRQAALNDYLFSCLIPTKEYDRGLNLIAKALDDGVPISSEKVNTISNSAQIYYLIGDFKTCIEKAESVLNYMTNQNYDQFTEIDLTGEANFWKGMALISLGDIEAGKQCLTTSSLASDVMYVGRAKRELSLLD